MLRKFFALKPLLAFLAFLALALSWSLGTPLLSAADEPEQSIRAAAVVRGEFSGADQVWNFTNWQSTYTTPDYLEVAYRLPRNLVVALAEHDPACYAFHADVPPACTAHANIHRVAEANGTALTHMNYSPLYYALVGWPSLFLSGDSALYGMRIVSALITAALLAGAFVIAARRGRAAAAGVVAAVTPAAIYFGAVVNPSGLEITSALLAWVSLISLIRTDPLDTAATRRDRILFTLSAAMLVLVRPLGPAWLAIIVVAVFAMAPNTRASLRQAVSGHGARWMGGVLAVAVLATGAWDATQNTMGIVARVNPTYTFAKGMHITLSQTPLFLSQMVGLVGWNDVHIPTATQILWYGAIIALLLAGLVLGNRRERLVLLGMAALVVFFPVLFEGYSGGSYGVGWQGRYTLPLAVGAPILAAEVLGRRLHTTSLLDVPRTLARAVGGTLAIAYLCEVWWAWRRYAEGLGQTSTFLPWHVRWSPTIGWPAMLGLAVVGCAGLLALLTSSSTYPDESGDEGGIVPEVPSQAPGASDGIDPLVSKLYE